jgi:outer membrane lipoprotein SlyB
MAMTQRSVAVGVFAEETQARQAIDELRQAGFSDNELGFLARARAIGVEDQRAANTTSGIVGGGVLGGVLGAAASILIPGFGPALAGGILAATLGGAALGAVAGGIIGSLTGMGIPEREAHFYQRELEEGRTIVTVKTSDATGYDEAIAIMRSIGAYDAATHEGVINATPPGRPYGTDNPQET